LGFSRLAFALLRSCRTKRNVGRSRASGKDFVSWRPCSLGMDWRHEASVSSISCHRRRDGQPYYGAQIEAAQVLAFGRSAILRLRSATIADTLPSQSVHPSSSWIPTTALDVGEAVGRAADPESTGTLRENGIAFVGEGHWSSHIGAAGPRDLFSPRIKTIRRAV
jgi:hypothetical protein